MDSIDIESLDPVAFICRPEVLGQFQEEAAGTDWEQVDILTDTLVREGRCWVVERIYETNWRKYMGEGYSPLSALLKAKEVHHGLL